MSPPLSVRAALQSIIPAPVDSRRSLTIAAVIVAIVAVPCLSGRPRRGFRSRRRPPPGITSIGDACPEGPASAFSLFGFCGHRLGLGHPAIGARRQSDFFADLVGGIVVEFGELPIVQDPDTSNLLPNPP